MGGEKVMCPEFNLPAVSYDPNHMSSLSKYICDIVLLMFFMIIMTSEPSTSLDSLETEKSILLQQALTQASKNRVQKQKVIASIGNSNGDPSPEQKQKLRDHPLMPIVQLLFKKCEQASFSLKKSNFDMDDVVELFKELEEKGVDGTTDDNEVDDFMKKQILEMRRSLVELERVYELTENFKSRYLSVLKRTVCHEALVGSNVDSDDDLQEPLVQPADEPRPRSLTGTTYATLQTLTGTLSVPLNIKNQQIAMLPNPSVAEFQKNIEFLKSIGYPQKFFQTPIVADETDSAKSVEHSPEKSEEEKQLLCDVTQ